MINVYLLRCEEAWGSTFGTAPGLWAGQFEVQIVAGAREFSLFQNVDIGSGPLSLMFNGYQFIFCPRGKAASV